MTEVVFAILRLVYVIIFFGACYISFKFEWSSEGKDERGNAIAHKSYSIIFPFAPFGWFVIELYDSYISEIGYESYKLAIWFLLTGLMIWHAINIIVLKRKY